MAVALGLLLGGCSSAKMSIRVDLYDEDPRVELPMTPRKARSLVTDLRMLEAEATEAVEVRRKAATNAVDVFSSAWNALNGKRVTTKKLRRRSGKYVKRLDASHRAFCSKSHAAVECLRGYVALYQSEFSKLDDKRREENNAVEPFSRKRQPYAGDEETVRSLRNVMRGAQMDAFDLVSDAVASYRDLASGPLFAVNWSTLQHLLNAQILSAKIADDHDSMDDHDRVHFLVHLGATLKADIGLLASRIDGRLAGPTGQLRSPYVPTTLPGAAVDLTNEVATLRNDLPESATSRAALSGLVQGTSRVTELVDRLQDAGDPIWRIVTDPENEKHWNKQFSKTYFFAIGNSGVVVVRDNPMRLRTQDASNNPRKLVGGQLGIVRSLANAAISIAGAASGIPTEFLASSKTGSTTANKVTDGVPPSAGVTKTRLDAWATQRETALRSLRQSLRNIHSNLVETDDDEKVAIEIQKRRLKSVVDGHIPLFSILMDSTQ